MKNRYTFILSLLLVVLLSACTLPLPEASAEYNTSKTINLKKTKSENYFKERLACAEMNDPDAQYEVARLFMTGTGVTSDLTQSVHWFEQAAQNGVVDAMVQMGHFYRDGYVVEKSMNHAIRWYETAANCDNVAALLALGDLYSRCSEMKPNYKKSYSYYVKAADLGSIDAELKLAWITIQRGDKRSQQEALERLTTLAEAGDPKAMVQIGDLYAEGRAVTKNWSQAYHYYQEASRMGSGEAAFKIGMMYEIGQGVAKDHQKATEWIMVAADRSVAAAEMHLADMYRDGWVLPKNYKLAAFWYERAIANGTAAAEVELADLYHAGKGVQRNLEEAFRWYLSSAKHTHDTYAKLMLSVLYKEGRGVSPDLEKSVSWYKEAKHAKDFAKAERKIAKRYAAGFGLKKNLQEAVRWYQLAADHSNVDAQLDLADLYYAGEWRDFELVRCNPCRDEERVYINDIAQNYQKAYQWYLTAAHQGSTYGQTMIGTMYLEGKGVDRNPLQASFWFRKAAYKCAKPAQYQLGKMYLQGCGVPQNDVHAYAWLKIALSDQMDKTPEILINTIDKMDPTLREQAVNLAKHYEQNYSCQPIRELPSRQTHYLNADYGKNSAIMREYSHK